MHRRIAPCVLHQVAQAENQWRVIGYEYGAPEFWSSDSPQTQIAFTSASLDPSDEQIFQ
jgi:hypothetical protein